MIDTHSRTLFYSGRHDTRRRRLRALLCIVALAGSVTPAVANPASCTLAEVTVWGVIAPASTYGLLKNLEAVPGVDHAVFDLRAALAKVSIRPGATVTDEQLRAAVKSASYTSREIRRLPECSSSGPGG